MEVIILAGGKGERLKSAVSDRPKAMAEVNSLPFLSYVLKWLKGEKATKIIISTGFMAEKTESYFGSSFCGIPIVYSRENTPLGTGGALKKALKFCSEEKVFALNGDTYFPINLKKFADCSADSPISLALKRKDNSSRYSFIKKNGNEIVDFKEKVKGEGLINGGIYCLNRNILSEMPDKFSLEKDYFEKISGKIKMTGFEFFNFFIDIGVPEDYEEVKNILGKKPRAVFFDRDGTLNVNIPHLCNKNQLEIIPERAKLLKKYNDSGYLSFVVTNQAGIAKGLYTASEVEEFHKYYNEKLEKEYGAHIDKFYYCPHHPDFTGECECRKPKAGMILKAIKEYGIDAENSVLYGDKAWDIEAGEAAGIKSILVESYEND